jgi:TRAP-type C4-dicarboxylate transport system substrate-binding protein
MPVTNKFFINDALYNKSPVDIQKAIDESSIEAGKYYTELCEATEKSCKSSMEKKGIKFVDTDRNIWVQKALSVLKKLENEGAWTKGLLKMHGLE